MHAKRSALTLVDVPACNTSESLIRCLDPTFDVVAAALPYFVRYRKWSASDTDLTDSVWDKEGRATNGGLPVDGYDQRRKYQVSTLETR